MSEVARAILRDLCALADDVPSPGYLRSWAEHHLALLDGEEIPVTDPRHPDYIAPIPWTPKARIDIDRIRRDLGLIEEA